eukprot:SAG31_NODE_40348_length_281_cov_0.857143_1_plen_61_part_10
MADRCAAQIKMSKFTARILNLVGRTAAPDGNLRPYPRTAVPAGADHPGHSLAARCLDAGEV